MDLIKESQQRKEFCDILLSLAKSQDLLEDHYYRSNMYKRLESLYDSETKDKRFRHFYTDIFSVLTQIQQNPDLGDINILAQNLAEIRSGYQPQNKSSDGERIIDISDAIKKLYDHVNLDIARIAYSDGADKKVSGESSIENLQSQIHSIEQKAQKIKKDSDASLKKINAVERKLDNSQKEYITILGIFASIVLAFTGGLSFSASVLTNISQTNIYRTILIVLFIGLVLINILFGLFYYINSLINKEQKIAPLIISNIIFVFFLILTVLAWNNGFVEKRDKKIEFQTISETQNISTLNHT